MIFSEWNPDGGYNYYESETRHPIGDDVPVHLPNEIQGIGIPAQDVGVSLPKDAVYVGQGDEPQGLMTPMARRKYQTLSGTSDPDKTGMLVVAAAVAGVLLIAGVFSSGRR